MMPLTFVEMWEKYGRQIKHDMEELGCEVLSCASVALDHVPTVSIKKSFGNCRALQMKSKPLL